MTEITDERVARALGWKYKDRMDINWGWYDNDSKKYNDLPPFSTSVDTAIKYLVPAMRERGWYMDICTHIKDFTWKRRSNFDDGQDFYSTEIKDDSPEALALAMCESALQILEKEKP